MNDRDDSADKMSADTALARAEAAERQRDEAFAKGAEAMREACAMAAWMTGVGFGMDESDARACAAAIRALPIPTQEGK